MLGNESPNECELKPPIADFDAPPPYEPTSERLYWSTTLPVRETIQTSLPTYPELATNIFQGESKLPSYEEVQNEKSQNGEMSSRFMPIQPLQQPIPTMLQSCSPLLNHNINSGMNAPIVGGVRMLSTPLTFFAVHGTEVENLYNNSRNILGTDVMFTAAFLAAFIFNWIGFLMITCFCQTIAARYGALSGFGLSLSKWSFIVKSTNLTSPENSWLWWLLMTFGLLICLRTLIQYINIKRTWRLLSTPE